MDNPTFSVITDLYSPSQLGRALIQASDIATALAGCALEHTDPPARLLSALTFLQWVAADLQPHKTTRAAVPESNDLTTHGKIALAEVSGG